MFDREEPKESSNERPADEDEQLRVNANEVDSNIDNRSKQRTLSGISNIMCINMPPQLRESTVTNYFSQFGTITSIRINNRRRFCFIQYITETEACAAIDKMDNYMLNGHHIHCFMSNSNYVPNQKSVASTQQQPQSKIRYRRPRTVQQNQQRTNRRQHIQFDRSGRAPRRRAHQFNTTNEGNEHHQSRTYAHNFFVDRNTYTQPSNYQQADTHRIASQMDARADLVDQKSSNQLETPGSTIKIHQYCPDQLPIPFHPLCQTIPQYHQQQIHHQYPYSHWPIQHPVEIAQ